MGLSQTSAAGGLGGPRGERAASRLASGNLRGIAALHGGLLLVGLEIGARGAVAAGRAVGSLLLECCHFYNYESTILNNNTLLYACWALAVLFLYWALTDGRLRWWLALGLCTGLGLLTKYTMAMLALPMLIFLIAQPQAHRVLAPAWPLSGGVGGLGTVRTAFALGLDQRFSHAPLGQRPGGAYARRLGPNLVSPPIRRLSGGCLVSHRGRLFAADDKSVVLAADRAGTPVHTGLPVGIRRRAVCITPDCGSRAQLEIAGHLGQPAVDVHRRAAVIRPGGADGTAAVAADDRYLRRHRRHHGWVSRAEARRRADGGPDQARTVSR